MALGIYEEEDIRALAEEIRYRKGHGSPMTVKQMKDGVKEVRESGFSDGYSKGQTYGESIGREQGLEEGKSIGYTEGKTDGIAVGVVQGRNEANAMFDLENSDLEGVLYGEKRGYSLTNNIRQAKFDLYEIGNAIRESGVTPSKTTEGYAENIGEIYGAGRKSQYDEMWDLLLNNGARGSFSNFFRESSFEYIRPNRKIIVTGSISSMFFSCPKLKKIESEYFDFSQVPRGEAGYAFANCPNLEEMEDIGLQSMATYDCTFAWSPKLKTIAKVRVDENTKFYTPFANLFELQHLIVEGVIGQNNFDVKWSTKLSKASWISIINALSETTSGMSITGSLDSVRKAFETYENELDGTASAEWLNLIATKSNWTVNLV